MRQISALLSIIMLFGSAVNAAVRWADQSVSLTGGLRAVHAFDPSTVIAVGNSSLILKTTDSGAHWSDRGVPGITYQLTSLSFAGGIGFAAGAKSSEGFLLKTTDNGDSWSSLTIIPPVTVITDVFFTSNTIGFISCRTSPSSVIPVYRSTDSGSTWDPAINGLDNTRDYYSLFFTDDQRGWLVGQGGLVYRTTDGGVNWGQQAAGLTVNDLNSVFFLNADRGWAVGNGGAIIKTTNSGTNWEVKTSGTVNALQAVRFLDQDNGWAAGLSGTLLQTTDGGETWIPTSETTADLYGIVFANNDNGWVVGQGPSAASVTHKRLNDPSTITAISPKYQGYNGAFTVNGSNFLRGITATATPSAGGTGPDSVSATWLNSSQLTVNLHLSLTATTGAWQLTLTNPDGGQDTLPFTVLPRHTGGGGGTLPTRDVVAIPSPNKNITPANPAVIQLIPQNGFSGPVTIHLMSITGQIIKTLETNLTRDAITKILYDGTDLFDHLVAPGVYRIQINAEGRTVGAGMLTVAR